jgi:hypothetical protein
LCVNRQNQSVLVQGTLMLIGFNKMNRKVLGCSLKIHRVESALLMESAHS